ncbi:MAG: hypothetical protein ABIK52_09265, partial [Bacteroidota bacterium]
MRRRVAFLLIILVAGFTACTPEYKLAREFRANPPEFFIHVIPPGLLYKYNHKGEVIEGFDGLSAAQQDSSLFHSSGFIRFINDSLFLENYVNNFLDELRNLRFNVTIGQDVDSFLLRQPQSYELSIAQIQVDEYFYPYEDQEFFYDTLFYKTFDLDAIDFSVWLELSKAGSPKNTKAILYSSHMASDDLEGEFLYDPFRQNIKYSYKIDSLEVEDLYHIAAFLGKVHASYLYDFFLN